MKGIVRNLTAIAAMAAALTFAAQARADTIDFFLSTAEGSTTTTPESGGSPAATPLVEVQVILTDSDFTTAATGASKYATVEFFIPGGGTFKAPVGINVDATSFTATSTQGGVTGTGNTNHAGSFNEETGGGTASIITYDLTLTTGGTWADAAAVLVANTDGWEAADNMGGTPQDLGVYATPLPAALPLFTSGLGVVGLLSRRKKKKPALAA